MLWASDTGVAQSAVTRTSVASTWGAIMLVIARHCQGAWFCHVVTSHCCDACGICWTQAAHYTAYLTCNSMCRCNQACTHVKHAAAVHLTHQARTVHRCMGMRGWRASSTMKTSSIDWTSTCQKCPAAQRGCRLQSRSSWQKRAPSLLHKRSTSWRVVQSKAARSVAPQVPSQHKSACKTRSRQVPQRPRGCAGPCMRICCVRAPQHNPTHAIALIYH